MFPCLLCSAFSLGIVFYLSQSARFNGHKCKSEGLFLCGLRHLHAYVGVTHTHFHVHMYVRVQWLHCCVHAGVCAVHAFEVLLGWVGVDETMLMGWVGPPSQVLAFHRHSEQEEQFSLLGSSGQCKSILTGEDWL